MYNLSVAVAHTFFVGDEQWLVHNCGEEALGEAVETFADEARRLPASQRPGTVAVMETADGTPFKGASGYKGPLPESVQKLYDDNMIDGGSRWHGTCAEAHCMAQAVEAGKPLAGSRMATALVGGKYHGKPNLPCPNSCAPALRAAGIEYVPR
jgi:hypothetical protein